MEKPQDLQLRLHVERPLLEHGTLNQAYNYEKPKVSLTRHVTNSIKSKNYKSCLSSTIPAFHWLRHYKCRENLVPDIISGLTVAIMHIPQGMAYALLGNLPPVVGIYMAFFPVLVYFFFGTSKHVSMGTFAVVCLMTGKAVATYSVPMDHFPGNNETTTNSSVTVHTPIEVATAVTFIVGIFQIIMYTFRLGIISTLLSETLVNGFTTGAAIYVLISQIKDLLGLKLPKQKGYFKLIFTVIDIFQEIPNANIAAVTVSLIAIIIMTFNNEIVKVWVSKRCSIPVPIELIAVVTGTLASNYLKLPETYGIETVGYIPTGLPRPQLPALDLLPNIAVDGLAITMVSYTITMSMALIFAQKVHYEVDSNQELLAMGSSNIFGAFFSCMPVSASLSRSLIQQTVGGRTQIASIVSCCILLTILLWIGPFFEPLPRCVLASIIVVALKGMLLQATQLAKFWKLSKLDAMVWIVTILTVVLVNIDVGLLTGLLVSLATVLLQNLKPYTCLLGHVPNTDLYLDVNLYKGTSELPGIKIFRYCGGLNFANCRNFKEELYRLVDVVPQKIIKRRQKLAKRGLYVEERDLEDKGADLRCVIIDMSSLTNIDPSSVKTLRTIVKEYKDIHVPVFLAGCSGPVYETIEKCDLYETGVLGFTVFATVHDAVTFSHHQIFTK